MLHPIQWENYEDADENKNHYKKIKECLKIRNKYLGFLNHTEYHKTEITKTINTPKNKSTVGPNNTTTDSGVISNINDTIDYTTNMTDIINEFMNDNTITIDNPSINILSIDNTNMINTTDSNINIFNDTTNSIDATIDNKTATVNSIDSNINSLNTTIPDTTIPNNFIDSNINSLIDSISNTTISSNTISNTNNTMNNTTMNMIINNTTINKTMNMTMNNTTMNMLINNTNINNKINNAINNNMINTIDNTMNNNINNTVNTPTTTSNTPTSISNTPNTNELKNHLEDFIKTLPSIQEYLKDIQFVLQVCNNRSIKSLTYRRLENLKFNFMMYKNLLSKKEKAEQRKHSRADFYTVTKIDTHIHHSAAMNSKHLQKFIKKKMRTAADEVVYEKEGRRYTLAEIFALLGISEAQLRMETLNTHALPETFQRFDRFARKYNPLGQPILREIFLKYDNFIGGKFLAQLTHEVLQAVHENKYVGVEYRISVYGKAPSECATLAAWLSRNRLYSPKVRWVIQIPRLYRVWRAQGCVASFGEFLKNIFDPLEGALLGLPIDRNLNLLLSNLAGFDCVDDESIGEPLAGPLVEPDQWTSCEDPPYFYYLFHLYQRICRLNLLRRLRRCSTYAFTPHAGETGDWAHLAHAFVLSTGICHGVQLRKSLPLQYLYYVAQVGIAMSPLSNNALFLPIARSPFPDFFAKGLRVTLSTDDPLQFHFTKEPLMEEYSVATQIWQLNSCDQCEIARNSVLISNFVGKEEMIGRYWQGFNDIAKTNVANTRVKYRRRMLEIELGRINGAGDE